jgi:UDP-glucose:(heptosyl)LPS alpha-1,3-glucosyltransferase
MRLAIVTERYHPEGGGAERSTHQIVCELVARGHEVSIIAGSAPRGMEIPGTTFHAMAVRPNSGAPRLIRFNRFARRHLDEGGHDASLSVTMSAPATIVQPRSGCIAEVHARNLARRTSVAGRVVKRVGTALSVKQQALRLLERSTVADARVKRFAAVSGYVARQLQQHHGIAAERIEVIPNASNMPVFSDEQRAAVRLSIRTAYGLTDEDYVLAFAALNPPLKGFATVLTAMKRLLDTGKSVTLLAAGAILHRELEAVARASLRERVRIVGLTSRMGALYAAADVTVLPSYFDPSSKVVIESLMMGTPAITSAFNGAGDFVLDGEGGPAGRVIDDPGDADALADAIAELADPAERARCRAATAGLGERLTMARHVARLESLLGEV